MTSSQKQTFSVVLGAIFLSLAFITAGFWVCSEVPLTTQLLSTNTSEFDESPYTHDELIHLAMETRDFTVGNYERRDLGIEGAQNALAEEVLETAKSSSEASSPKADQWTQGALDVLDQSIDADNAVANMEDLYVQGPQYALDKEALSHLDDVNMLLDKLFYPLLGCVIIAAFLLMVSDRVLGPGTSGRSLRWGGFLTLFIFLILGIWAGLYFEGFFTALHSLFFADGSWYFPSDSLLIQMYPISFWMGMGIVWLAVSVLLAIASIVIGTFMIRGAKFQQQANVNNVEAATSNDAAAE